MGRGPNRHYLSPAVAYLERRYDEPYWRADGKTGKSGVCRQLIELIDDSDHCMACIGATALPDSHQGYPQKGCPCMDLTRPNNVDCHHKDLKEWRFNGNAEGNQEAS